MLAAALLLAAADPGKHTQETTSLDIPLIIGTIALVALVLATLWFIFLRTGKVTKRLDEPPSREQRPARGA